MENRTDMANPDLLFKPELTQEVLDEILEPSNLFQCFVWVETVEGIDGWYRQSRKNKLGKKARKKLKQMLDDWNALQTKKESTDYSEFVKSRFKIDLNPITPDMSALAHASIGIATESGELLDALKKHWVYEQSFDVENAVEEIGDLLFYIEAACQTLGVTMQACKDANVDKLKKRYPDGYTNEAAKERADKVGVIVKPNIT